MQNSHRILFIVSWHMTHTRWCNTDAQCFHYATIHMHQPAHTHTYRGTGPSQSEQSMMGVCAGTKVWLFTCERDVCYSRGSTETHHILICGCSKSTLTRVQGRTQMEVRLCLRSRPCSACCVSHSCPVPAVHSQVKGESLQLSFLDKDKNKAFSFT